MSEVDEEILKEKQKQDRKALKKQLKKAYQAELQEKVQKKNQEFALQQHDEGHALRLKLMSEVRKTPFALFFNFPLFNPFALFLISLV